MKPARACEGTFPVDTVRAGYCDGTSLAVIHHLGRPLVGADLEKVNSHPSGTADDARCIDTMLAQVSDCGVGDWILFRQDGDKRHRQTETGERYGNVRFSSAECGDKLRALKQSLRAGRRQPEHDFP